MAIRIAASVYLAEASEARRRGNPQQEADMRKSARKPTQKASKKPLRDLTTLEARAHQVKAGARARRPKK
jgi:hypothetical protein